jgi:hypothetical protein
MLAYGPCTNGEAYIKHEGFSVSGYGCGTQFADFLTPPGGGSPSSLHVTTPSGYSVWEVPLNDIFGSTIAEIDTHLSGSPIINTYTYDPNGKMKQVGTPGRTPWAFFWHGLENEASHLVNPKNRGQCRESRRGRCRILCRGSSRLLRNLYSGRRGVLRFWPRARL